MRLREYSEAIPKPMVQIGYRPILWNIMRFYAHFGHKDFILCLGHKADMIKDYFVNYDETISNDFVYERGGKDITLLNSDIDDWRITFVDTGINANIGMRLMQVREHLEGEEMFLANYSDGLSNLDLNTMIDWFSGQKHKAAAFMAYQPNQSFHVVRRTSEGLVESIDHIGASGLFINTGYFVLRPEIFDYIEWGDELVEKPFQRLIGERKLVSWEHSGFWASMDTYKEKQKLDELYATGKAPWEVWRQRNGN
jgi:glucose-1-phosphate cytidylyltransferase